MLLGLMLLVMAATEAYEVWQGWGTDRIRLAVGMVMAPFMGVCMVFFAALMLRLVWTGGAGDGGWDKGLPIACGLALLSIPVALALDPVMKWQLRSDGYWLCPYASAGRYVEWNEWVRGSAACAGRSTPP